MRVKLSSFCFFYINIRTDTFGNKILDFVDKIGKINIRNYRLNTKQQIV